MDNYPVNNTHIEADPKILEKTGRGGLLSKGYLHKLPFIEYLQPDEEILVLLWSDRTAPVQEGPSTTSFELNGYGALTAVTHSRVLTVVGTPSGNKHIELPIETIETITTGSKGRLRPEGWLRFETPKDTLTVFDYSGLNIENVRTRILEAIASAACQQVNQTVEQAQTLEQQRKLSEAKKEIEVAYEQRKWLEAFQAKHDTAIQVPKIDLDTPRERILRSLEFDKLLQQADSAEDNGELSVAIQAYKEAIKVETKGYEWIPPVDPSSHIVRLEFLRAQQKTEAAIERAESIDSTPERYTQYRTALDALEECELKLSEFTFNQYRDAGRCVICGTTNSLTNGSVADLTGEGTALDGVSSLPICVRCETLSNAGPRWDQHDIDNRRTELAKALVNLHSEIAERKHGNIGGTEEKTPHSSELCVALTRAATELDHPPSTTEFTDITGYTQETVVATFGSWGAGLDATDLDIEAALLTEIREFVEQTGLVPTISEMYKHSRYPESVFDVPFEKPVEAIKAAGYDPLDPVRTKWYHELRSLAREHSGLPLRERAQQTRGINVSELISTYSSWEDVLAEAGIIQDELQYKTSIASDIERLEKTLGHTPSTVEYVEYGSFEKSEVKEVFGSFEQALSVLKLPERQVCRPDNSIDEPPDGSQEVPSHTTLLQELNWLQQRHGSQKAKSHAEELTVYNTKHFELQFGSFEEAFEILNRLTTRGDEYIPKRYINEDLAELGKVFERPPTLLDLLYHSKVSLSKYEEKFESLTALHEAAGFEIKTAIPSNDDLLSDLTSVAESLGHPPTIGEYDMQGKYRFTTLIRRFDDWLAALNAAGLNSLTHPLNIVRMEEREVDRVRFETQLRVSTGLGKPEVLIDELYRLAHEFGEAPTSMLIERYSLYPESEFDSTFGSVEMACERAGLSDDQPVDIQPIDYTQQLTYELSSLAAEFGHHPTPRLVNACAPSPMLSFITTFGNWEGALEAAFDQPNPPRLAKPYVEAELKDAIERLDTVSRKETTPLIQALPEECTYEELNIIFESIDDAIAQADEATGEDQKFGSRDDRQKEGQTVSTTENHSNTDANRSTTNQDELVATLQSIHEAVDRLPRRDDLDGTQFTMHDYVSTFGDWEGALNAAGVDTEPLLLSEIERIARKIGREPSTSDIDEQSLYSLDTYCTYFGSWDAALEATSLADTRDRSNEESPSEAWPDNQHTTKPSRQALINELHQVNEITEGPLKAGHMQSEGRFSVQCYSDTFGSWEQALEAADIDRSAQLLTEIERVTEQLGRVPSQTEMNARGKVSAGMITSHFGSWVDALRQTSLSISNEASQLTSNQTKDRTSDSLNGKEEQSHKSKAIEVNTDGKKEEEQFDSTRKKLSSTDADSSVTNRDELLATLQSVYETVNRLPKRNDLEETQFSMHDYTSTFENWEAALEAAGIDKRSILLSELERVAKELGRNPTTSDMNNQSPYWGSTYSEYFGSWNAALEAASLPDFDNLSDDYSIADGDTTELDRQTLIDELHRVNEIIDGPLKTGHMHSEGRFSMQCYSDTFGSWEQALEAADINYGAQLLAEIERVAEQFGHPPSKTEMDVHGKVSAMTPANYFGGWRRALKQTNLDISDEISWPVASNRTTNHTDDSSKKQKEKSQKTKTTSDSKNEGEQGTQTTFTPEKQSNTDADSSHTNRDELLATLQSVHEAVDRLPRRDDLEDTQFTMRNYVSTFGSWGAALKAAGIDTQPTLVSELERVARELSREPTPSDMTDRSPYPGSTYSQYFGSWDAALAATSLPDFENLDEIIDWVIGEKSSSDISPEDETGPD